MRAASADGRLPLSRLESYLRLQKELAVLARQQDERAQLDEEAAVKGGREGAKKAPQDEIVGWPVRLCEQAERTYNSLMLLLLMLLGVAQAQPFFTSILQPEDLQNKQAVLETSYGTIVMDLLADAAPTHVAHFITRVVKGAYDGTVFHRVVAMGIIQGGDPLSTDPTQQELYGSGGLGVLRLETNSERHTRGAVSAVLVSGDPDSGGSQFFICITDQPAIDGRYTIFARVREGIAVAQKISLVPANANGMPEERLEILRAFIRDTPPPEPSRSSTRQPRSCRSIRR